jgi:SNF2 family DNA or RNA helicase
MMDTHINLNTIKTEFDNHGSLDPPEPWQLHDLWRLSQGNGSTANWSEMGGKKTSTGLWHVARTMRNKGIKKPAVLVVTTKSGKGTFFQLAPQILPGWHIFNVGTKGVNIIIDGRELKLGLPHIPEAFDFPALVVTHYNLFSKSNLEKFETDEAGQVVMDENGKPVFLPWVAADYFINREWDFVWLDEAHRIKNREGKWTVNLKKIKSEHKHVSTGTGFINRPDEIWSLLNFIDHDNYKSYWKFRETFCWEENYSGYRVVKGIKPDKVNDFRKLVRDFGPRRTLDEVMPHLLKPIFVRREVELSPVQRKMYNEIKLELRTLDKKGVPLHSPNVLAALQRMRQICVATPEVISDEYDPVHDRRVIRVKLTEPSSKLDALMDILDDSSPENLFVVFSCFKDPLELLKARLDKHNKASAGTSMEYKYIHMQENDNDQTRYQKWALDFPTGKYKIFMSTLQLGGESINLTPARYVVFLDRSWSPKDNMQAIGRIRRPGQEGQPVVINIEANKTTDQRLEQVNAIKGRWFHQIFGAEDE